MMVRLLFSCVIEGFQLVPCVRMTQKSKWTKQARKYLENQKQLAWLFKKKWGNKEAIAQDIPLEISFSVHYSDRRLRDSDNCDKALRDALQKSGIIKNDRQIRGTGKTRIWNDRINRVVVELCKLKEEFDGK